MKYVRMKWEKVLLSAYEKSFIDIGDAFLVQAIYEEHGFCIIVVNEIISEINWCIEWLTHQSSKLL